MGLLHKLFTRLSKSLIINFFFPVETRQAIKGFNVDNLTTACIIPTYNPNYNTYKIVKSILSWHRKILIIVVDDCTPNTPSKNKVLAKIKSLSSRSNRVVYLRTDENRLKAGALNFGIDYLFRQPTKTQVVFTLDDDVYITKSTLPILQKALYSHKKVGAVCSLVRVSNKKINLLTRLQGLEYHSFNMTKIADNTFLQGPLVMQGVLTAFRTSALREVKGFTQGHLIEDYDITAKIKAKGWTVEIVQQAFASTEVPDNLSSLWKQRVRWTYGGLRVVRENIGNYKAVFQDLLGHVIYLSLLLLILISLSFKSEQLYRSVYFPILIAISFLQFIVSFIYGLMALRSYSKVDKVDYLVKLSIIPEFVYSNFLSIILVGSYLYYLYTSAFDKFIYRYRLLNKLHGYGLLAFQKIGFSLTWGTRQLDKKGGLI